MPEEVMAGPFKVCRDCPARGNLSAIEHHRKCYGQVAEAIGAAACGKKQILTKATDLYPEIFRNDD
jgi:hypothetical protein